MIKIIKLLILSALLCRANTLVIDSTSFRTSSTYQGDGTYLYFYSIDPWELSKKDLSNFQIFWCPEVEIYNLESNIAFETSYEYDKLVFENLENDNNNKVVYFSFESKYVPVAGTIQFKLGKDIFLHKGVVPGCIPEPSTSFVLLISMIGLMFIRKRT
jgi:hypothetical protein